MAATRPFLDRTMEQIKFYSNNPAATRMLTETKLLEDIRRAHAGLYEDIAKAIGPEARYFYTQQNVTLSTDQEWLAVPPTFRKFTSLVQRGENNEILRSRSHVDGLPGSRIGVVPIPDLQRLRFTPKIDEDEVGTWELVYESGPCELHYGVPVAEIAIANATFTNATKTLALAGAFTSYTFKAGDVVDITGGTGVTVGQYAIASKVDNNSITLATDIGGVNPSDVGGGLYKVDTIYFPASATKGEVFSVDDYYIGARIYVLSGNGIAQTNSITAFVGNTRKGTLLSDWTQVPDSTSVYEIRPWIPGAPDQYDEIIAWRAALKYRRARSDEPAGEAAARREITNIMSELVSKMSDNNVAHGPAVRRPSPRRNLAIWSR